MIFRIKKMCPWLFDTIILILTFVIGELLTHAIHSYEKDVDNAIKEIERRTQEER